jgi:hypothetical protein
MRWVIALLCAGLMARFIWLAEWYDVLRHGLPGAGLLAVYAAYVCLAAGFGWFLGSIPKFLRPNGR